MPYISMTKPKKGQRRRMSEIPTRKAAVPFHFWRRAKKTAVFWGPIIRVRPIRKRIWRVGALGSGVWSVEEGEAYVSHC
jgi:hypothetical protein